MYTFIDLFFMYIHVYVYTVCIHICICICIYTYTYFFISIYKYKYTCILTEEAGSHFRLFLYYTRSNMFVPIPIYIYVCIYIRIYVRVQFEGTFILGDLACISDSCICIYILSIHIYINIHINIYICVCIYIQDSAANTLQNMRATYTHDFVGIPAPLLRLTCPT